MRHRVTRKVFNNAISGLSIVLCMLAAGSVWAADQCQRIEAEGNVAFIGPLVQGSDPVALGVVTYSFPDGVREAMVTSFLIEPIKTTEDGTIHLVTDVLHDFPGGDNLTWRLSIVLSPTDIPGEFRLNEHNMLVSGAGIYVDAFARSTGHGIASFNTGQATVFAKGRICGIAI